MTYHRKSKLLLAVLASIVLAVGFTSAPANAASKGGKIKGVVTLDGKPLKGAKVKLMRTDTDIGDAYSVYKTATTSSKGYYSFSGSPIKGWTYNRVIVSDPQHRAVTTVRSLNGRSKKTVTRNVTMKAAGSITGKVTLADGSAPTATQLHLEGPAIDLGPAGNEELAYLDERQANANGTYRFVGLPAGTYTLSYADSAKKYLNECYDDIVIHQSADFYCENATKITVKAGSNTPLVEQQLNHESAHLRGTVTNTSGQPLKNIFVTPYRVGVSTPTWYQTGSTRSNGRFAVEPIDAGSWQLQVRDNEGVWESRWYNSASRSGAQVFPLAEGTSITNLAIKLKSRAALSAKAAPGTRRATFTIKVVRKATGGRPSGKVTVALGDVSRTVSVTKGAAKVTLTGLPAGKQKFQVEYKGTSSTADARRTVSATIR